MIIAKTLNKKKLYCVHSSLLKTQAEFTQRRYFKKNYIYIHVLYFYIKNAYVSTTKLIQMYCSCYFYIKGMKLFRFNELVGRNRLYKVAPRQSKENIS